MTSSNSKSNSHSVGKNRIFLFFQMLIAMASFWIVREGLSELTAYYLMKSSMSDELALYLYQISRYIITIVVAFPVYLIIMRVFGTLKRFHFLPKRKLSVLQLILSFLLASIVMFVMVGVEFYLCQKGVLASTELFSGEPTDLFMTLILGSLLMPLIEEIMFRGFMLERLKEYGYNYAIILSTLFFVLGHPNPVNMIITLVPGIIFGILAIKTEGIVYGIAFHILINLLGNLILPYLLFR